MTKKEYIQAAKILRQAETRWSLCSIVSIKDLEKDFADWFAQDNPRFDREKFLKACKGE